MTTGRQPKLAELAQEVPAREAWQVFGIMAEFEAAPAAREGLRNL